MLNEIRDVNASLWISASAGTGKTKSLIDRILALLLNGVNASKVLCLTYTNAAATEMLARLSDYLKKINGMSDHELKSTLFKLGFDESFLLTARSLFEKSISSEWVKIQTIHGFCFELLRKFPLETGLFPGVKLCDDYLWKQLMNEAINSVLTDEQYGSNLGIISKYTMDIFVICKSNSIDIQDFLDKSGDFDAIYTRFFNINSNWLNFDNEEINNLLFCQLFQNNHRKIFAELAEILFQGSTGDIKKAEILQKNSVNPTEEFIGAFLTLEGTVQKTLCTKKIANPDLLEKMNDIAQRALDFSDIKKCYVSAKANAAFFKVMEAIFCKFRELKSVNHCLDFDDIIRLASSLLENIDWVMYKIDGSIDHILVDEAQDTSPRQWEIIRKVTDEFFAHSEAKKTIFVVGDEKQSIYSFQGANIKLFKKMHDDFKRKAEACGQKFYDIVLNKSYRTTGNILSFIDRALAKQFINIHTTNREANAGLVEIVDVFEDESSEDDDFVYDSENADKKLSFYIADLISKTIKSSIFVESKNRAAKAEDFLILFQHRNIRAMNYVINALKMKSIPVSGIDRIILQDELIVEDLIALAEFSVFPLDDLMCARVLKSPVIGMVENELMQICMDRKDDSLFGYLQRIHHSSAAKLQDYVDQSLKLSAYDFFMHVLHDGVKEKFISRFGEKCLDILNEFLGIAMHYERENMLPLQSFLEWFRSFEHEVKRESFIDKNAVRLMTVHASKGLQSPFVILADCHFVNNKNNELLKTEEDLLLWNFSKNFRPHLVWKLYENEQMADYEESYRLFYVAMTRAEDFLYIFGEKHKNQLSDKCWYSLARQASNGFERIESENLCRFGNYTCANRECETADEHFAAEVPAWFHDKLAVLDQDLRNEEESQIIYGNCVHLLLSEIPIYMRSSWCEAIVDQLLEDFNLSKIEKEQAKTEAFGVIKEFSFLFDIKSRSEVSFVYDGQEGRIDKIAFQNDVLWIVDFKTGEPKEIIPDKYVVQLDLYRKAVKKITGHSNIKTAILWTQNQSLVDVRGS